MSISGLIRKKPTLSRLLLFILLAPVLGAGFAITLWSMTVMIGGAIIVIYTGSMMLFTGVSETPSIAEIASVDMRLEVTPESFNKEDVYISHDGSYIGITSDRKGEDEDKENAYEFTLMPRSAFEQHTKRIASTFESESKYFKQRFDSHDETYTIYGKPSSEEVATNLEQENVYGAGCVATPMWVTQNHIQVNAGCGKGNRRAFLLEAGKTPVSDSDLPVYFKGSSRYESPLRDCATFLTDDEGKKTICYHLVREKSPGLNCGWGNFYCTDAAVRFTNTKTQQQATWSIPEYMDESGFLNDGTFYATFDAHSQGVYVVPSDYFINHL